LGAWGSFEVVGGSTPGRPIKARSNPAHAGLPPGGRVELAYFTADGVLLPALPRYVAGPLRGGNVAVGLVIGAFSLSAFFLRPWAGAVADRRGRRILMVSGASLFALSVAGYLVAAPIPTLALALHRDRRRPVQSGRQSSNTPASPRRGSWRSGSPPSRSDLRFGFRGCCRQRRT
jgi:hypothetical protein